MRTAKPVSTISYNTPAYLKAKLEELVRNRKVSDYMFIEHMPESDETKKHIHLFIVPNTLIDTMDIQDFLKEPVNNSNKPLGCIDFRKSQEDDWILYVEHYLPYLASKCQNREWVYEKEQFVYHDEDTFNRKYLHAHKASAWAQRNQILEMLKSDMLTPTDLINNGTIPLNLASQLNAYKYMQRHFGTKVDRDGGESHSPKEEKEQEKPSTGKVVPTK